MSRAVSMRPDLYAAYLHGASQWDGSYAPVAEERVAVYIFMAENDEYYGSQKARDAYNNLYVAYVERGMDAEGGALVAVEVKTGDVLACASYPTYDLANLFEKWDEILEIPDNAYFNSRGIYNYHSGGNILFDDQEIIDWIIGKQKARQK